MGKTYLYRLPDISQHQGSVNFKRVRDAGYPAVMLRAGYGRNNIDQRYAANALACLNLQIPAAVYWFSYALSRDMADYEAACAIGQAAKYWTKCPVAFDLEYDSVRYAATKGVKIDRDKATGFAVVFLDRVAKAGYVPVLYTNKDYLRNYFDYARIRAAVPGVKLWYALYGTTIPAEDLAKTDLWQYTSKAVIPGISGNVDLNNAYTDIFFGASDTGFAPVRKKDKTPNLYIRSFQTAANADGYRDQDGKKLAEDGIDGAKTQYVRRKVALKAKRAGFTWTVGSTGALVKWWQGRCNDILAHANPADGRYGRNTRAETVGVQKRFNLTPDGVAGYNTLQAAFYN